VGTDADPSNRTRVGDGNKLFAIDGKTQPIAGAPHGKIKRLSFGENPGMRGKEAGPISVESRTLDENLPTFAIEAEVIIPVKDEGRRGPPLRKPADRKTKLYPEFALPKILWEPQKRTTAEAVKVLR